MVVFRGARPEGASARSSRTTTARRTAGRAGGAAAAPPARSPGPGHSAAAFSWAAMASMRLLGRMSVQFSSM